MVKRIFVEKKKGYAVEAQALMADLKDNLNIKGITGVRVVHRYDVEGISTEEYERAKNIVFSEPPVDNCYDETIEINSSDSVLAIEYLPGQYDQRADSAMQCIQILTCGERPSVKSAKLVIISGNIDKSDFSIIKDYLINPVEAHEARLDKPKTLVQEMVIPEDVETVEGFIEKDEQGLEGIRQQLGLAMDSADIAFCRDYFKNTEQRNPSLTEIRMIDTYWSDHCRHTTFATRINEVEIEDGIGAEAIRASYEAYLSSRKFVYGQRHKDICLMDIATLAMKRLKKEGILKGLDESEEINACSVVVDAYIDGKTEQWLVMFKNETHNHPTEIEPFGGAATCLGGAIRDPLSGRSYVYQAMRVTGSGDPRVAVKDTLPGKLPQKKITTTAAAGYSSYGNQIGLATGQVNEIYHSGYVAKRMEIGAVIGAAPKDNVRRERPEAGDIVILLGGRTGRDGCGGATGSSKAHTEESLAECGAEVQKGNPPEERKIQRLFRNSEVTRLIKRCNDFGAGGVSVAIGELADGLYINLDSVPKKYEGLDGTELAISESQERMAVVVAADTANRFIELAANENLEAVIVAQVTEEARLVMDWRGKRLVDISRDFLNTNGAPKDITIKVGGVTGQIFNKPEVTDIKAHWLKLMGDLNVCSQKGLVERFDASIGAGTVLMPFGGKHQLTPTEAMAAKLPVLSGNTTTATVMSYGYNPFISEISPYHGAVYAVVEAVSRLVAAGGDYTRAYLTLQEYFERLGDSPIRWGKPFSALLGAFHAQIELGIAAIGGKDSMSGSFKEMDVPPTLVAFSVGTANTGDIISPEFKKTGSTIVYVPAKITNEQLPDFEALKASYTAINNLIKAKKIISAQSVRAGGISEAIAKMSFGNNIGAELNDNARDILFAPAYGSFVLEVKDAAELSGLEYTIIGTTTEAMQISIGNITISIDELLKPWTSTLEGVFPTKADAGRAEKIEITKAEYNINITPKGIARPRVFIPVFPGTNCEYDTARVFEKAGAIADVFVIKNLNSNAIEYSLSQMAERIGNSQIIMIPGGFSGGDEPDGSGKFIAAAFRNPFVKDAVHELLKNRDGLMLGICNGFQALIKLGLVPYGEIRDLEDNSPTLTFNTIGRHISCMVNTRIASNKSPWLWQCEAGDIHTIAVSHGEGRFVANDEVIKELVKNNQIATQYVDLNGNPTYDIRYNPNGSVQAIEGITSPDGRVLGKMGHSERIGDRVAVNIIGNKDQKLFEAGVRYFK